MDFKLPPIKPNNANQVFEIFDGLEESEDHKSNFELESSDWHTGTNNNQSQYLNSEHQEMHIEFKEKEHLETL